MEKFVSGDGKVFESLNKAIVYAEKVFEKIPLQLLFTYCARRFLVWVLFTDVPSLGTWKHELK